MKAKLFLWLMAIIFWGCNSGGEDCSGPFSITSISPDANPAGYEILITGEGFSENSRVFFSNTQDQTARLSDDLNGIIATVPVGIPPGTITLSVEDGGCNDDMDFDVWGSWNSDVPQAPLNIVIPVPPASYPSSINNFWKNVYDEDHGFFLQDVDGDGVLDDGSEEDHFDDDRKLFQNNPISGTYDKNNGQVILEVDRTGNGGEKVKYTGVIVDPALLEVKNANIPSDATLGLLLEEEGAGRQLLLIPS
jgi:hypothetical protein